MQIKQENNISETFIVREIYTAFLLNFMTKGRRHLIHHLVLWEEIIHYTAVRSNFHEKHL